jgi:hypothetical protein
VSDQLWVEGGGSPLLAQVGVHGGGQWQQKRGNAAETTVTTAVRSSSSGSALKAVPGQREPPPRSPGPAPSLSPPPLRA